MLPQGRPLFRVLGLFRQGGYLGVDELHGAVVDQTPHRLRRVLGGVGQASVDAVAPYGVYGLRSGVGLVLRDDVAGSGLCLS